MSKTPQDSQWEDLNGLDRDAILIQINEKKAFLRSTNDQIKELRSERKEQVEIVKSLRSAVIGLERSDSGRKKLLNEFHISRKEAQKHRESRDAINKLIPPPSKILEEWLRETFESLTKIDNDLTTVQMLNPELSSFSRFFEIQASISKKREAEKAHSEYISKVSEMRKISSKLDQNRNDANEVVSNLGEGTEIEESKVSRKEVRRISKRISAIDKKIDSIKQEEKSVRIELKRIEKFSRISSVRKNVSSIEDIRGIAAMGGQLSTEELGALLETGGFSAITKKETHNKIGKPNIGSRKKNRKIGVSRRGSRRGSVASRRE